MKPCKWQEDENGIWNTECGEMYEFMHGGLRENRLVYCPYCGKKIIEKVFDNEITLCMETVEILTQKKNIISSKGQGIFHRWKLAPNRNIYAVVEVDNGQVQLFHPTRIRFINRED